MSNDLLLFPTQVSGLPQTTGDFTASRGGPFDALQTRLGLLNADELNTGRRIVVFIAIAWGTPFMLALLDGLPAGGAGSYLRDMGVWAMSFVAIGAFVLADEQVEDGLRACHRQFLSAQIIAPASTRQASDALRLSLGQRDSKLAETIFLAAAVLAALLCWIGLVHSPSTSWAVTVESGGNRITPAGWWSVIVSVPLFWFLMLRVLWRHFVWSQLLRRMAKLELRLVATHPDGMGGLAFVSEYPNAYMAYVFGVSAVVAVTLGRHFDMETLNSTTLTVAMACWLVLVLALFAQPLAAFSKPLADLKAATIAALSGHATHYQRFAERKLLGRNVVAGTDDEAATEQEIADPSKLLDVAKKLSTFLVNRKAVLPIGMAALLPFALEGATRLPVKDISSILKELLLI